MRFPKTGHLVEFVLWVALAALLYSFTYDFDQEIEIYKYGASTWPRAILILIAVAATGQLLVHLKRGNSEDSGVLGAAADDGTGKHAAERHHNTPRWYLATFCLLALPLLYVVVPEWIGGILAVDREGLGTIKMVVAAVLLVLYLFGARGNHVGAILTLPILFGVGLQDFGFYALAPAFILGVMYLMGERRAVRMAAIGAFTFAMLLFLFVTVLYVGLPTGNIHPFYDFGTTVVTILQ